MPQGGPIAKIVALAASVLLIAMATLVSQGSGDASGMTDKCLGCAPVNVPDAIANVVLFVPFGVVLRLLTRRTMVVIATAFALTVAIELVQWSGLVSGRHASFIDVVANTLGAAGGAVIAFHAPTLLRPGPRVARRLLLAHVLFVVMVLAFGEWATSRAVVTSDGSGPIADDNPRMDSVRIAGPVYSALPFTTGYGWFERDVSAGVVNGVSFTHRGTGALIVTDLARDTQQLSLTLTGRDRRTGFVPVLFVHAAGDSLAHTMIGQRGDGYALRVAVRANRFGMRLPDLVVRDAAAIYDTIGSATSPASRTLTAVIANNKWELVALSDPGRVAVARVTILPLSAWMLFLPVDSINGTIAHVGTAGFLLLLTVPVVYWTWRWMQRRNPLNTDAPVHVA